MINHFPREPQLATTSKTVLWDPPSLAFVMPKEDWLQSTAPWIPSWIKLKKYYIHRFVPRNTLTCWQKEQGPQAELDVGSPSEKHLGRHLIPGLELLRAAQLQPSCRKQLPHKMLLSGHQALWQLHSFIFLSASSLPESLGCIPGWFRLAACLARHLHLWKTWLRYNSFLGHQSLNIFPPAQEILTTKFLE